MSDVHAVIMAGGRGTRFWPASRESLPKQFLPVAGKESLLTRTGRRVVPLAAGRLWVVTSEAHVGLVSDQLPEMARERVVGEPVGRNTAPCIALAAALVERVDPEAVLLVCPADHWIADEEAFLDAARTACAFASEKRALVTFGVVPSSPETGYGYIEKGEAAGRGLHRAAGFTEKPDPEKARAYLEGGRHLWNSGIFAWRADVFLRELEAHEPAIARECRAVAAAGDRSAALAAAYPGLPSISVDYALLERSQNVYVLPAVFPWSDVGSWDALAAVLPSDDAGNVLQGDVIAVDSRGCFVRGASRLTAVVGLEDVAVVDTADALLVCAKSRAQDVKKVVEQLESSDRSDLL